MQTTQTVVIYLHEHFIFNILCTKRRKTKSNLLIFPLSLWANSRVASNNPSSMMKSHETFYFGDVSETWHWNLKRTVQNLSWWTIQIYLPTKSSSKIMVRPSHDKTINSTLIDGPFTCFANCHEFWKFRNHK